MRQLITLQELRPHEQVIDDHLLELTSQISMSRKIVPILVDKRTGTILDGHHRTQALRLLGYSKVPAIVVDYKDADIKVRSWKRDVPVSKDEVVKRAMSRRLFPPKTSKHLYRQPDAMVAIEELI